MTSTSRDPNTSPKLKPWHLDRAAIVYVRQSTPQQVLDHQESTARQYALADRAVALGWPAPPPGPRPACTPPPPVRPGRPRRRPRMAPLASARDRRRPGQEWPVDRGA